MQIWPLASKDALSAGKPRAWPQLIYGQILAGHFAACSRETAAFAGPLTLATIELHTAVSPRGPLFFFSLALS